MDSSLFTKENISLFLLLLVLVGVLLIIFGVGKEGVTAGGAQALESGYFVGTGRTEAFSRMPGIEGLEPHEMPKADAYGNVYSQIQTGVPGAYDDYDQKGNLSIQQALHAENNEMLKKQLGCGPLGSHIDNTDAWAWMAGVSRDSEEMGKYGLTALDTGYHIVDLSDPNNPRYEGLRNKRRRAEGLNNSNLTKILVGGK